VIKAQVYLQQIFVLGDNLNRIKGKEFLYKGEQVLRKAGKSAK
jgi:hypothetical protein